jgi:hypothetical protein
MRSDLFVHLEQEQPGQVIELGAQIFVHVGPPW